VVKHEGPKATRSPGRDSNREPAKYNLESLLISRFLAKTVCWRAYIVHAVYKLLVCFRHRRRIWSSSIHICGAIQETDFEGFEFFAAYQSSWCSTLRLLKVNTYSPSRDLYNVCGRIVLSPPLLLNNEIRENKSLKSLFICGWNRRVRAGWFCPVVSKYILMCLWHWWTTLFPGF
jgi:hypothetical protein